MPEKKSVTLRFLTPRLIQTALKSCQDLTGTRVIASLDATRLTLQMVDSSNAGVAEWYFYYPTDYVFLGTAFPSDAIRFSWPLHVASVIESFPSSTTARSASRKRSSDATSDESSSQNKQGESLFMYLAAMVPDHSSASSSSSKTTAHSPKIRDCVAQAWVACCTEEARPDWKSIVDVSVPITEFFNLPGPAVYQNQIRNPLVARASLRGLADFQQDLTVLAIQAGCVRVCISPTHLEIVSASGTAESARDHGYAIRYRPRTNTEQEISAATTAGPKPLKRSRPTPPMPVRKAKTDGTPTTTTGAAAADAPYEEVACKFTSNLHIDAKQPCESLSLLRFVRTLCLALSTSSRLELTVVHQGPLYHAFFSGVGPAEQVRLLICSHLPPRPRLFSNSTPSTMDTTATTIGAATTAMAAANGIWGGGGDTRADPE